MGKYKTMNDRIRWAKENKQRRFLQFVARRYKRENLCCISDSLSNSAVLTEDFKRFIRQNAKHIDTCANHDVYNFSKGIDVGKVRRYAPRWDDPHNYLILLRRR